MHNWYPKRVSIARSAALASIYDLAKTLRLSVGTISKALNGYSDVSDATHRAGVLLRHAGLRPNIANQTFLMRKDLYEALAGRKSPRSSPCTRACARMATTPTPPC